MKSLALLIPAAVAMAGGSVAASAQTTPAYTQADVRFMQGMIGHHSQALAMVALIPSRTTRPDIRALGERIRVSQQDEIALMKQWLRDRNQEVPMTDMSHADGMGHAMQMPGMAMSDTLMPGMLTTDQMIALRNAKGAEFDRLFLKGMIQHHGGALVMVKEMFDTAGAGQDAELFNFATDVDSGQRAEIRIMETMLGEKP